MSPTEHLKTELWVLIHWIPAGDTPTHGTAVPIFPQLNGAVPPEKLPFGVHFLCGDTFDGEQVFAGADLQKASQRDTLLAARILEPDRHSETEAAMARAMGAKLRLVGELRETKRHAGCPNCSKAVLR